MKPVMTWLSLTVLLAPIGCEEKSAPADPPDQASSVGSTPAHASEAAGSARAAIPVPADFEDEAATDIDSSNYRDALEAIEAELEE